MVIYYVKFIIENILLLTFAALFILVFIYVHYILLYANGIVSI